MGQEIEHAWAAGLIDGEGCITIKVRRKRWFALIVTVSQSGIERPAVIDRLHELYGGSISVPSVDSRNGRRPRWSWTVASAQAEAMLRKVLPYLVGKREQAEVALCYRETALGRGNTEVQREFYDHLRALKKEGEA